jgi:hypothetical protein
LKTHWGGFGYMWELEQFSMFKGRYVVCLD